MTARRTPGSPARADSRMAVLEAEIDGYRRLLSLLHKERDALRKASADALPEIAEEKFHEVEKLLALVQARVARFEDGADRESDAAWQELCRLAADAKRQNELNGRLIAVQQQHFDRALSALYQAAGVVPLYGADGRAQGSV